MIVDINEEPKALPSDTPRDQINIQAAIGITRCYFKMDEQTRKEHEHTYHKALAILKFYNVKLAKLE